MRKIIILLSAAWLSLPAIAQNATLLEYFIDSDAGVGKNTLVTINPPVTDGNFNFNVNLSGVSFGRHNLYVRVRDDNGNWGQTVRRNIEVFPTLNDRLVVAAEYFFDVDPGLNQGTPIAVSPSNSQINQDFVANTTSLSPGFHKMYIRTFDDQGHWSLSARRTIDVPNPESNVVSGAEYFFNTDPGIGHATPVTVSPQGIQITEDFIATTSALSPGYHKLYIRTVNEQGKWGLTARRNVQVIVTDGPVDVVGVEYFFGTDSGVGAGAYYTFANPQPDGTFILNIPQNQVPNEKDTLYIRVRDNPNGYWSLTKSVIKNFKTTNCGENIWIGMVSTDWHNPSNWSCNEIPDLATEVIINSETAFPCEVLAGNTALCRKIAAVPGSNVKVLPGAIMTVAGP